MCNSYVPIYIGLRIVHREDRQYDLRYAYDVLEVDALYVTVKFVYYPDEAPCNIQMRNLRYYVTSKGGSPLCTAHIVR